MRARRASASFAAAGAALVGLLAHCGSDTFAVAPPSGDAAVDGAVEGGPGDPDASSDSGADGAGAGFCASSQHALCFDFDKGDGLAGWVASKSEDGSAVVADDTKSASPPRSAHFALAALGRPRAQLLTNLPPNNGTLVCRFDVFVTALPTGGDVMAISFDVVDSASNQSITYLALRPGAGYIGELGGPINASHSLAAPPPSNGWHTLELRLSLPNAQTIVLVDTVEVLRFTPAVTSGHFTTLTIGGYSTDVVFSGSELRFDNIACD